MSILEVVSIISCIFVILTYGRYILGKQANGIVLG